jgi:hypothetical protein
MPIAAFALAFVSADELHDRELASSLGDMVVAWSAAEYALINVFGIVTSTPWAMASVGYYQIPTFESRTKVLRGMLGKWETDRWPTVAISTEIEGLNRLGKTRNHWIHAYWVKRLMLPEVFTFDMRAEPREPIPVKAADIRNHVAAVHRRNRSLHDLIRVPAELPSTPRES